MGLPRFVRRRGQRTVHRVQDQLLRNLLTSPVVCLHSTNPSVDRPISVLGCLNTRSVLHHFDDIVVRPAFCWFECHQSTSPTCRRCRELVSSHGGIVIIAAADIVLSPIVTKRSICTTFELVRVAVGRVATIVISIFPAGFKEAFIIPMVKKPGFNVSDVN